MENYNKFGKLKINLTVCMVYGQWRSSSWRWLGWWSKWRQRQFHRWTRLVPWSWGLRLFSYLALLAVCGVFDSQLHCSDFCEFPVLKIPSEIYFTVKKCFSNLKKSQNKAHHQFNSNLRDDCGMLANSWQSWFISNCEVHVDELVAKCGKFIAEASWVHPSNCGCKGVAVKLGFDFPIQNFFVWRL